MLIGRKLKKNQSFVHVRCLCAGVELQLVGAGDEEVRGRVGSGWLCS